MATVSVFSVFYFFLILFQCHPVSYFWAQYSGEKGSCVNPVVIADSTYAHSAVSVAADWTLGILPIFIGMSHVPFNVFITGLASLLTPLSVGSQYEYPNQAHSGFDSCNGRCVSSPPYD